MRAWVMDDAGEKWLLPYPTAWKMEYTSGTPCDSFWLRCPWSGDNEADPARWTRVLAEHEGERVFTGVVDEIEIENNSVSVIVSMFGRETSVEFELDQVEVVSQ